MFKKNVITKKFSSALLKHSLMQQKVIFPEDLPFQE
jgi:hypothetical protein